MEEQTQDQTCAEGEVRYDSLGRRIHEGSFKKGNTANPDREANLKPFQKREKRTDADLEAMQWVRDNLAKDDETEQHRFFRAWKNRRPDTFGQVLARLQAERQRKEEKAAVEAGQMPKEEISGPESALSPDNGTERVLSVARGWLSSHPGDLLTANVQERIALLEASKEEGKRGEVMARCSSDIEYYINHFVWQYNPKKAPWDRVGPFILWPFQAVAVRKILDCITDQRDLVIEKSREMGASWLCLIAMEWLWHFHPWNQFLMLSRSESAVDRPGDPDCLFWKLDFMHDHEPDWMIRPQLGQKKRRKLGFVNHVTHSTITGQASTGKAGVGGRSTAMFVDEFAQFEEDYEVLHRTSDTADCRIFNSTHLGLDTAFYELTQRRDMRKLILHWTEHPWKKRGMYRFDESQNKVEVIDTSFAFPEDFEFVKDGKPVGGPEPGVRSPWYDEQCLRKGSARAVAMDLDINPSGSVAQVFDAMMIRVLQNTYCTDPVWRGELLFNKETGKPEKLVQSETGRLHLWIAPKHDGTIPVGQYKLGVDISTGNGTTNSCISIIEAVTGEKIGEYQNPNIFAHDLAALCVALCWTFKEPDGQGAGLAWERQGPGEVFGKRVSEMGYRHVYRNESSQVNWGKKQAEAPGWYPTPSAKNTLLEEYQSALRARQYLNHSRGALEECLQFRYDPQGYAAHPGRVSDGPSGARVNHGDQVVADALSWRMAKAEYAGPQKRKREEPVAVLSLAWRRQLSQNRQQEDTVEV